MIPNFYFVFIFSTLFIFFVIVPIIYQSQNIFFLPFNPSIQQQQQPQQQQPQQQQQQQQQE